MPSIGRCIEPQHGGTTQSVTALLGVLTGILALASPIPYACQMNRHDLESDFNGQSTDTLTVTATTRYTSADAVPSAVAAVFVHKYGQYAKAPTLAAVLALTDEQRLTSYTCTVVSTQDTIEIVTTHMGDTLVGVAMHNGQQVGELNDGFLSVV